MDCPACGRANAVESMECEFCSALLVDAFVTDEDQDDAKTDPIEVIGSSTPPSADTDELLRAARAVGDDDDEPREALHRLPNPQTVDYTGDLPRLFCFGNRYQILEKLGEGGMGRVYKALDFELDRPVALKTIRGERGNGKEALERFKQELVLARKVTHKNVIRIYDLGQFSGMKFFTMELVEGKSFRELLTEKKKVPVKDTLSYMKQMLNGLGEAHNQGVVHRDLKPQNIMVDQDGNVRIMDFGIARTVDSATMTGTGEMMGTPDYISPEQVRGETADSKSDLYSFGVILFELLTGETPFKGDTPIAKIVARIQAKPPNPRALNKNIPMYLERIILKCLEADPELRYQTAEEVLEDLTREQVDSSYWLRTKKAIGKRSGWVTAACLAGALGIGGWYYSDLPDGKAAADVPVTTIAILPFHNTTGTEELEWMENGIPEMLITDMSQLQTLRPVTTERVSSILRQLGKLDQTRFDEQTIDVAADMASADYALYGRFVQEESQMLVAMTLRDSETGLATPLNVTADPGRVFALVDKLTDEVSTALSLNESNLPIGVVSTESLEALRAYQRGMAALRNGAPEAAIPLLETSVELDSNYAIARARLAKAYLRAGNQALASQQANLALALSQERELPLPEHYEIHATAAIVNGDADGAVRSYRKLAELYPQDPDVLFELAGSLRNLGERDEAIETYRVVLKIAPGYEAARLRLASSLTLAGKSQEAINVLESALTSGQFAEDPGQLGRVHELLGGAYRRLQRNDKAIEHYEEALRYLRAANNVDRITRTLTALSGVYQQLHRLDEATRVLEESLTIARENNIRGRESYALLNLGNVALEMGNLDAALERYQESLAIDWDRAAHNEIPYRLNAIAEVYRLKGAYIESLVFLDLAKHRLNEMDNPAETAFNAAVHGQIRKSRGQYRIAMRDLLTALPELAESGYARDTSLVRQAIATIYMRQGRLREGFAFLEDSLREQDSENEGAIAMLKIQRAELLLEVGAEQEAEIELNEAELLVGNLPGFEGIAYLNTIRGKWLRARREYAKATAAFEAAIEICRNRRLAEPATEALVELAWTFMDVGQFDGAERIFKDARQESRNFGHRVLEAEAALGLARTTLVKGQLSDARGWAMEAVSLATEFGGQPLVAQASLQLSMLESLEHDADQNGEYVSVNRILRDLKSNVPDRYLSSFESLRRWSNEL